MAKNRTERMIEAKIKGTHTRDQWETMKLFFKNTCVKCLGKSGLLRVEKDHIIPIYQGGSDSIKNIQPMCARCNASKGPETVDYRIRYCKDNNIRLPKIYL